MITLFLLFFVNIIITINLVRSIPMDNPPSYETTVAETPIIYRTNGINPLVVKCWNCEKWTTTTVVRTNNEDFYCLFMFIIIWGIILLGIPLLLVWIPFMIYTDRDHYCSNCKAQVGQYRHHV